MDERRAIEISKELFEALKPTLTFTTREQIEQLTYDQALEVLRTARRTLLDQLLSQEYHEHMSDDCGDYLDGATSAWNDLWEAYGCGWHNESEFTAYVREWLLSDDLYACDGDPRFELFSEDLMDSLHPMGA